MNALIIDNGSKHTDKINDLLPGWDVVTKRYDDESIHDVDDSTLVILSGGSHKSIIGNEADFANETQLIRDHRGPIIGICLGFEAIAHTYGEYLTRLESRIDGVQEINLATAGTLGLPAAFTVYEAHRWAVRELNSGKLEPMASSDDGVEMLRHVERPVYGVQFHPEVLHDNSGAEVFKALVKQAMLAIKP